jgi:D-alanyl-D-alanine carboxypeptidase
MNEPEFDDRGQAWSVFFGVAAIVIGLLVLVSRIVVAFDGPEPAARPPAADAALSTAATIPTQGPNGPDGEADAGNARLGGASNVLIGEPEATSEAAVATPTATPAPVGVPGQGEAASPLPASASEPPPQPTPAPPPPLPPPTVSAQSVAILERSCGALVYGLNEDARVPPASLTKIVAALVAVDRITDLNARVADTHISAKQLVKSTDSSVMGIEPGMTFTVRDLMYGLILPSGNDAALQLAEYLTGSQTAFVALMNAKAAALGMTNTQFVNPHGLDAAGHFSTALDMAKGGLAFLSNPLLAQIAVTRTYETPGDVRIVMKNGNRLLDTYPGAFGVKIGYTTHAKQTFVAAASRGGRELIVSLMGSEDRYADATALLDWAFSARPSAC